MEQAREVDDFLLALVAAELDRHRLRIARDRRAVSHLGRITQSEPLHERRRDRPLKGRELASSRVELLGTALGPNESGGQPLEDQEHGNRGHQREQADAAVREHERHGNHADGELARHRGPEKFPPHAHEGATFLYPQLDPEDYVVHREQNDLARHQDEAEDDALRRALAMHAGDATGEDAHDQSTEEGGDPEPGEVVQPFARRAARDDRVQSDGGHAAHRRGSRSEQAHRQRHHRQRRAQDAGDVLDGEPLPPER